MGARNLQTMLNLAFFTSFAFDFYLCASSSVLSSFFHEKYTLSILDIHDTKTIDFMEQAAQNSLETLTTRSRTGQSFICYLPQAKNINDDGSSNVTMKITNADIHSRLKAIDGSTGSLCPILNQGWWTYEFCFGSEITQFHQDRDKGSVNNIVLSLGVFSHETMWDNQTFTAESIKTQQVTLHHVQHYTNGSKCELTSQSRSTKVRFFCGKVFKIQITEPSTCTYLVTVNTPTICDLPIFKAVESETVEKISCVPDVDFTHLRAQKLEAEVEDTKSTDKSSPVQNVGSFDEGKGSGAGSGESEDGMGTKIDGLEGEPSLGSAEGGVVGEKEEQVTKDEESLLTPLSSQQRTVDGSTGTGVDAVSDLESNPNPSVATGSTSEIPLMKPFQKEPQVISSSQLRSQMNSLSDKFAQLYSEDNTQTIFADNNKLQSKKVSLYERFLEEIVWGKKRANDEPESKTKTALEGLIEDAQTIENGIVVYVDRLGEMIARSEVPALLLTDLKYTLRTIKALINDFANRNIQSLYETVLRSPDPLLAKKLEGFASPVVEEYVENLAMLSETLTTIEFLVDYYGKFLPVNEDIDKMSFGDLKSLYDDIVKQYTMPESIVKEARAIFNIIETRFPSQYSGAVETSQKTTVKQKSLSVDNSKDSEMVTDAKEDVSDQTDQSGAAKERRKIDVDPKFLKLLRELLKQARQLAFFEETNQMMSSFYSKQNRGMDSTAEVVKKDISKSSKKDSSRPEKPPRTAANKRLLRSKATWEDYKNVMLGRDLISPEVSGKTVIKVKMSQLLGDEKKISKEGGDEFTIELDEGDVLEGIDLSDVKEMEVHFLAIGSSEDYAKMTQDPAKLAQIVKEALSTGQTVRFDGDQGKTPTRVVKTEREHFELKSRYWDSYELHSGDQPLGLIDSIKEKITGGEESLEESNVNSKTSSASYSRKYHLI